MPRYAPIGKRKVYARRLKKGQRQAASREVRRTQPLAPVRRAVGPGALSNSGYAQKLRLRQNDFRYWVNKYNRMYPKLAENQARKRAIYSKELDAEVAKLVKRLPPKYRERIRVAGGVNQFMPVDEILGFGTAGAYFPKQQLLALDGDYSSLLLSNRSGKPYSRGSKRFAEHVLLHELTHAGQRRRSKNAPDWFAEGQAETLARRASRRMGGSSDRFGIYSDYVRQYRNWENKRYRRLYGRPRTKGSG